LEEVELPHLDGHKGSRPVRIGNGAANHIQLVSGTILSGWRWCSRARGEDIYGELYVVGIFVCVPPYLIVRFLQNGLYIPRPKGESFCHV
jgi:hypothetical protein